MTIQTLNRGQSLCVGRESGWGACGGSRQRPRWKPGAHGDPSRASLVAAKLGLARAAARGHSPLPPEDMLGKIGGQGGPGRAWQAGGRVLAFPWGGAAAAKAKQGGGPS